MVDVTYGGYINYEAKGKCFSCWFRQCNTGLNVIRALVDEANIAICGCDFDVENPSKQWCLSFEVPRCASPDYPAAILDIVERYNITHIIASNDHDVRALTELTANTVGFPFFNGYAPNILSCLDKKETEKLFNDAGVQTPSQIFDLDGTLIDVRDYQISADLAIRFGGVYFLFKLLAFKAS